MTRVFYTARHYVPHNAMVGKSKVSDTFMYLGTYLRTLRNLRF